MPESITAKPTASPAAAPLPDGAGVSPDEASALPARVTVARLWCAHCGQSYECRAEDDFMLPIEAMLGVDRFGGVYGWLGRHDCEGAIDYGF